VHAVLYDVHGNAMALEAVLADARAAGAERFVLGGDYTMAGAQPTAAVALLDELDARWIRGNTDRWVADVDQAPEDPFVHAVCAHARADLGEDQAARLAALPESVVLGDVLFCHASPHSDMETFMPEPVAGEEELLDGAAQPTVVFGHSHLQFTRSSGDRLLVNPGSVGMPLDGDPRAGWALWDGGASLELRRTGYDRERYLAEVRRRMTPALESHVQTVLGRIEQARP
jgi:predicted phosphodiesterase